MNDPYSRLLQALSALNTPDKYDSFKVSKASYKHLGGSSIHTDILIPSRLLSTKAQSRCPVMVRVHGGFLVTGSSHYPPWFANWTLDYALSKNAVILAPNYRLLPEASGKDILEDLDDFWRWLRSPKFVEVIKAASSQQITPDLDTVLVVGESAGGFLAMHLALSYPSEIRALIGAYPMLDVESEFYTRKYPKPIIGVPNMPNELIEQHLSALRATSTPTLVTAADPPDRLELAFSIFQNGRLLEFLGPENTNLFPMRRAQDLAASGRLKLPPTFIFHGRQDSAVPFMGSQRFFDMVREKSPDTLIELHGEDGDHGVDFEATLETEWLKMGLEMISNAWVGAMKVHSNL
ncbi:unnamed protein product [Penicillium olsonii]|uniref:Alpha/beta hydrolase fold-3 domain-containing protein n=1 Tax=Penicillium olsonii TaxID=99116 RepID=A0A9W4HNN5_PENOL|nr:unnamed protein product [Penicillium olsonii]CAG8076656.1 unnamed protein product [Penicillium olsonii]